MRVPAWFPRVLPGVVCVLALPAAASAGHYRAYDSYRVGYRTGCGVNRVYDAPIRHVPRRRHVVVQRSYAPRVVYAPRAYARSYSHHYPRYYSRRHVRSHYRPYRRTRCGSDGFGFGFYRGRFGSGFGIHFD